MIAAYVFTFGAHRVVQDDHRRVVATQLGAAAEVFATIVEHRSGIPIDVQMRTPLELAEAMLSAGVRPDQTKDRFRLIEAGAADEVEAVYRAADLADRVPLDEPEDT